MGWRRAIRDRWAPPPPPPPEEIEEARAEAEQAEALLAECEALTPAIERRARTLEKIRRENNLGPRFWAAYVTGSDRT